MTSATLTPIDLVVGGDTTLQVALTTAHRIPKKGKIQIAVTAPWNDGATDGDIAYFSSVVCKSFSIGGVAVTAGTYACSFLENSRVELKGGFDLKECPANTEIKINIVGFRNPIQANTALNVFTVYTSGDNYLNTIDYIAASVTAS